MENVVLRYGEEELVKRMAKWLAERDGAYSSGSFSLNPKFEYYLEEAEGWIDLFLVKQSPGASKPG